YDWAFYRNAQDNTFRDVLADLTRPHAIIRQARLGSASDQAFWIDPFSEAGAQLDSRAAPIARDVRLAAENALVRLYQNREKARAHTDTLEYMEFAGLRLDLLGEKIEF